MPTLKLDITQNASFTRSLQGHAAVRVGIVTGLSGSAHARLHQAASADGLPALGSAHPVLANMRLESIHAKPQGDSAAILELTYKVPSIPGGNPEDPTLPRYEVGASLITERVSVDAQGDPIEVSYDGNERLEDEPQTQRVTLDALRPQTTLRVVRLEADSPGANARLYVGKVNLHAWQGGATGTWLCTGIHGRSPDNGATWLVTYDFQYHPGTWRRVVRYINPRTGRPPADADEGEAPEGITTVDLYQAIDFADLGI